MTDCNILLRQDNDFLSSKHLQGMSEKWHASIVTDCVNAKLLALAMEVAVALAFLLPTEHVWLTPSAGTSHRIIDFTVSDGSGLDELRLLTVLSPKFKNRKSVEDEGI